MKISIITVAYNAASTIRDTIETVLNQTYQDIEYIVIDGFSKDNTVGILKEYEPLFHGRMKWRSEKDEGLYDAMNKGIAMATGEVVGILNADDFYTKSDVIEKIMEVFKTEDYAAVTGNLYFVNSNNLNKAVRYFSSKYCKPKYFGLALFPAHPTFFVRKKYYDSLGLYDKSFEIGADLDLMIRFLKVNNLPYKYLDFDMVVMRTCGKSTNMKAKLFGNNRDIIKAYKKNNLNVNYVRMYFRYIFRIAGVVYARFFFNIKSKR